MTSTINLKAISNSLIQKEIRPIQYMAANAQKKDHYRQKLKKENNYLLLVIFLIFVLFISLFLYIYIRGDANNPYRRSKKTSTENELTLWDKLEYLLFGTGKGKEPLMTHLECHDDFATDQDSDSQCIYLQNKKTLTENNSKYDYLLL